MAVLQLPLIVMADAPKYYYSGNWKLLADGMGVDEVVELLGEPAVKGPITYEDTGRTGEAWKYQNTYVLQHRIQLPEEIGSPQDIAKAKAYADAAMRDFEAKTIAEYYPGVDTKTSVITPAMGSTYATGILMLQGVLTQTRFQKIYYPGDLVFSQNGRLLGVPALKQRTRQHTGTSAGSRYHNMSAYCLWLEDGNMAAARARHLDNEKKRGVVTIDAEPKNIAIELPSSVGHGAGVDTQVNGQANGANTSSSNAVNQLEPTSAHRVVDYEISMVTAGDGAANDIIRMAPQGSRVSYVDIYPTDDRNTDIQEIVMCYEGVERRYIVDNTNQRMTIVESDGTVQEINNITFRRQAVRSQDARGSGAAGDWIGSVRTDPRSDGSSFGRGRQSDVVEEHHDGSRKDPASIDIEIHVVDCNGDPFPEEFVHGVSVMTYLYDLSRVHGQPADRLGMGRWSATVPWAVDGGYDHDNRLEQDCVPWMPSWGVTAPLQLITTYYSMQQAVGLPLTPYDHAANNTAKSVLQSLDNAQQLHGLSTQEVLCRAILSGSGLAGLDKSFADWWYEDKPVFVRADVRIATNGCDNEGGLVTYSSNPEWPTRLINDPVLRVEVCVPSHIKKISDKVGWSTLEATTGAHNRAEPAEKDLPWKPDQITVRSKRIIRDTTINDYQLCEQLYQFEAGVEAAEREGFVVLSLEYDHGYKDDDGSVPRVGNTEAPKPHRSIKYEGSRSVTLTPGQELVLKARCQPMSSDKIGDPMSLRSGASVWLWVYPASAQHREERRDTYLYQSAQSVGHEMGVHSSRSYVQETLKEPEHDELRTTEFVLTYRQLVSMLAKDEQDRILAALEGVVNGERAPGCLDVRIDIEASVYFREQYNEAMVGIRNLDPTDYSLDQGASTVSWSLGVR